MILYWLYLIKYNIKKKQIFKLSYYNTVEYIIKKKK